MVDGAWVHCRKFLEKWRAIHVWYVEVGLASKFTGSKSHQEPLEDQFIVTPQPAKEQGRNDTNSSSNME